MPGIAGFACAAVKKTGRMDQDNRTIKRVRERLISELKKRMPDRIRINSPEDGLPGILSVSFSSVKSEVILHALELSEIYVSSGSACSAKKNSISHDKGHEHTRPLVGWYHPVQLQRGKQRGGS